MIRDAIRFDRVRSLLRRGGAGSPAAAGVPAGPSPIVFIHIPKSAGTTFAHYLKQHCEAPEKAMLAFYGDYSIYNGATDVPVVCAHAVYHTMKWVYPNGRYVTWLRDPIARAISQYKSWNNPYNLHEHWLENMPRETFEHVLWTQNATLEEFVFSDHPEIVNNLRNVYTAVLSSEEHKSPRFLASAQENLAARFRFFGLVERFDESMRLFKHALGWQADFAEEGDYANRSVQKGVVPSPRAIQRLVELNADDLKLYEFAKLLFEDRLRRLDADAARRAAVETRAA